MEQEKESQPRASIFPGILKTSLWLCAFLAFGWLVAGALFKGKSTTANNSAGASSQPSAQPEAWLVGEKNSRVRELAQEYKPIQFEAISDYVYYTPDPWDTPDPKQTAGNKIPDDIKALNGKKVAITGFMMPVNYDQQGATLFVLNGNYDMCSFGGPVMMNQWVMVKYQGKGKVPYTHLPLTAFGTLEVGEEYKEGRLYSLYRMNANAVSTPKGVVE